MYFSKGGSSVGAASASTGTGDPAPLPSGGSETSREGLMTKDAAAASKDGVSAKMNASISHANAGMSSKLSAAATAGGASSSSSSGAASSGKLGTAPSAGPASGAASGLTTITTTDVSSQQNYNELRRQFETVKILKEQAESKVKHVARVAMYSNVFFIVSSLINNSAIRLSVWSLT
jgi:hypothetical protein